MSQVKGWPATLAGCEPQKVEYSENRVTSRLQVAPKLAGKKKGFQAEACNPLFLLIITWWASRESNTAPTDYESAALTRHELEAQFF
jgi:hypothetical protein